MKALIVPAALALLAAGASAATLRPKRISFSDNSTVTVQVAGVRSAKGNVHVDLCPQDAFLHDCPYSASVPAQKGVVSVTLRDVPAGRYAVQAFHDANGNGELDQGLFGIPKEGLGFSNDAMTKLKRPKWEVASFDHGPTAQTIPVTLHYFLG